MYVSNFPKPISDWGNDRGQMLSTDKVTGLVIRCESRVYFSSLTAFGKRNHACLKTSLHCWIPIPILDQWHVFYFYISSPLLLISWADMAYSGQKRHWSTKSAENLIFLPCYNFLTLAFNVGTVLTSTLTSWLLTVCNNGARSHSSWVVWSNLMG